MVTLSMEDKTWNKKYEHLFNREIIHKPNKYSEHGEDNIIKCIFPDLIGGTYSGYFVDVGAREERSSNTYALIDKDWSGLLIEADGDLIPAMKDKFENSENVYVIHEYVRPNSLDKILRHYKVAKNFDFLSIDVDSFEYEIWRNLKEYQPNLVCVEINQFETDFEKIGYDPSFSLGEREGYGGATVGLMNRLAEEKGYDYLCLDVSNAFYIRKKFANGLHR